MASGYTFATLKAQVLHALGGSPNSRVSASFIVNEAIRFYADAYDWTWRKRLDTLDFDSTTTQIILPDDFGEMIDVAYADGTSSCQQVDFQTLQQYKQGDLVLLGSSFVYCVMAAEPSDDTEAPGWVLEIYPQPSADEADALNIAYYIEIPCFTEDDSDLTEDTFTVHIPQSMQFPLIPLCRAMAKSLEVDPNDPEWQRATADITMAIAKDGRTGGAYAQKVETTQQRILEEGDAFAEVDNSIEVDFE